MGVGAYYRWIANASLVLNLVVGISAVYVIERLIPILEGSVETNASILSASNIMLDSMLLADADPGDRPVYQERFWQAFERAKQYERSGRSGNYLKDIDTRAQEFWSGDRGQLRTLVRSIQGLSALQVSALQEQRSTLRFQGVASGWALGGLIIVAIIAQLIFRNRLSRRLVEPLAEMIGVLRDFTGGNRLRRFYCSGAQGELHQAGIILNRILDESSHKS